MVEEDEDVAEAEVTVEVAEEEEEEEEVEVAEAIQMLVGSRVMMGSHMKYMRHINFIITYGNNYHIMRDKEYLKIGKDTTRVGSAMPVKSVQMIDQMFLGKCQVTHHNHKSAK